MASSLGWLAQAQEPDGHWSTKRWGGEREWDVGATGLALTAFGFAGYTHVKGSYKATVARGLRWLRDRQQRDGRFPCRSFEEQGIATLALCEAYGLTRDRGLRSAAQRAVDYICATQPRHGGFGPKGAVPKAGGDMYVTAWQVVAIRAAMYAELRVPKATRARFRLFLRNTYRQNGGSAKRVGERETSPSATAAAMLCCEFLDEGWRYDDEIAAAASHLLQYERGPGAGGMGRDHLIDDLDYTWFSGQAMALAAGERWVAWKRLYLDRLREAQIREGTDPAGRDLRGSWNPARHARGEELGRVYTTAMALLCLEAVPRRSLVYRRPARP